MSPIVREYYRVPRGDREVYLDPAAGDLVALVSSNRRLIESWDFEFAGRPIREFLAAARAEVMAAACRYAERWHFTVDGEWAEPQPIIATGHQPPPFHPGVWFKNFLAGSLARAVGGVALNLAVDNDEAKGLTIRFPVRDSSGDDPLAVRVAEMELASPAGGIALEEQSAQSPAQQADVLQKVQRALSGPLAGPFREFCQNVPSAIPSPASLAEVLSAARHKIEERCGLRNRELPVSVLADTRAFQLFSAEMIRQPEKVFAAHNGALAEYRRVYRERSAAQPVPDLAREGDRIELPLWVWRTGGPRRHLWVEERPDGELAIQADRELVGLIHADDVAGADSVAARLAHLREAGWKIRPRAITLTLFVRLAAADAFIHGLGGALYDKATDAFFERLFGVPAPQVVLASCTVHLPLETYPASEADLAAARRAVRDWRFSPDRRLSDAARRREDVAPLIDEKRRLIAGMPERPRPVRREDYRRIHQINELLSRTEPEGAERAARRLEEVSRQLRYNAILRGREYPFFFYDPEDLAAFYRRSAP